MERGLEYRKIQRVGRGSYIVTLPQEWIKDLGLGKGDSLALKIQEDSSLLLAPRDALEAKGKEAQPRRYRIYTDLKDDAQSVIRKITSLYVISADLIHIHFKGREIPPEHKSAIYNLAKNSLLGSEVIDETSHEITIQVLINHPEFPVEKAIRRMAIVALSANRDAILALEKIDQNLVKGVLEACNDVDRLNLYVIRQLKYGLERNLFEELGFKTQKEFLGYRIVANDIKGIADNALNLANNIAALRRMTKDQLLTLNEPIDEEMYSQILEFNGKAHYFFEETLKGLFKRDYEGTDKLISEMGRFAVLEGELITLMSTKKTDPNVSSILRLAFDGSRRIIEYSRDVAEVTLNRTVEEISQPF